MQKPVKQHFSRRKDFDLFSKELMFGNGIGIRSQLVDYEGLYWRGLQKIVSADFTGKELLQKLEEVDTVFITGYSGRVHIEGEMLTEEENKHFNKDLASFLRDMGYAWVSVKGLHDKPEAACIVFNVVESQGSFISDIKGLANIYKQASFLIWPLGKVPYSYCPLTQKARETTSAEVREVLGFDDDTLIDAQVHYPIRQGYAVQHVRDMRPKWRALITSSEGVYE